MVSRIWSLACLLFLVVVISSVMGLGAASATTAEAYGSWVEAGTGAATRGGGISQTPGFSEYPELAVGSDGTTVVVWEENHKGSFEIYVKRWNGSAWVEMGAGSAAVGISSVMGGAYTPALAVGPDNRPVVAWAQVLDPVYPRREIFVKRWNGSAWVEVGPGSATGGGISNTPDVSSSPTMAVDPAGRPVVAWVELYYRNDNQTIVAIHVRRWNGSAWAELGPGSASGDGISHNPENNPATSPSLAIGPGGGPIVAWLAKNSMWANNEDIFVKRWDGSAWVEMGEGSGTLGITDYEGIPANPVLATGPNKLPLVAWMDGIDGRTDIYVRRYPAACHALTLAHEGQGGNPTAAPAHSAFCPKGQYNAGEPISLTAAPAPGWIVAGWSGTNNDSTVAFTNALTMPDAARKVSVSYKQFLATDWSYVPVTFR